MRGPNVFTVPLGAPFLDTLVGALLDGRLVEGHSPRDPFALADVTIYLPTRRAARAIREPFLARFERPLLLPRIRTLGDLDEDDVGPDDLDLPALPAAVPPLERQLVLTKLILAWSRTLARPAELGDEEFIVPSSPADAAWLAAGVAALIDQVGTRREAWAGLFTALPADLARYWQITLEFLRIATEFWPAHLAERGLLDPGDRRDRLLRAEAERLARHGSPAPVIAAGSTGSVPATAALLAAIARLPNGAVVLPGLDQDLDEAGWQAVGPGEDEPAGAGHPQYGLKKLLEGLGIRRRDVEPLGGAPALAARRRFASEALRPAGTTEMWSGAPVLSVDAKRAALQGLSIIEAANEREEALAVAVVLREAAERPGEIAALVTPDRSLARRVAVELLRWDIVVDDSGGRPLGATPPGVLARLVAEVALRGADAHAVLALLKHPLATFGSAQGEARRTARALERAVLRGPRLNPGLAALRHALESLSRERAEAAGGARRSRPSEAARGLSAADWAAATDLAARLQQALGPLESLAASGSEQPLPALAAAHAEALTAVARNRDGGSGLALAGEAGEALGQAFDDLLASAAAGPPVLPADYPGLFAALGARSVVRRRGGLDPRIHIWGVLEARLQSVDTIVLGGLNEGTWPGQTRLDPLLSRPMRAALDLEPPERRIGLAAHDFAQALGHSNVWISRARRQDGEPRVASRWLQRLTAFAGDELAAEMRRRGDRMLSLARRLDAPLRLDRPERPRPSPALAARPRSLSATQIETLIRDPYAIYARHVLRLRPFEAVAELPDAAERGTLIHDVLERFVGERPRGPFDADAEARLLDLGRNAFARLVDFPEIAALWWPRFERIARWFVATEGARPDIAERRVEGSGRMAVTADFELTARADRLDRLDDGTVAIVDYKTGSPPSIDEVLSLSPQLPLEALIAGAGGFEGIAAAEVSRLEYYHLSGRGEGGAVHPRGTRPASRTRPEVTLPEALALTEVRLQALIAYFARPDAEYLSRKIPRQGREFAGDYDHLARVAEWSVADAGDNGEAA